MTVRHVDGAHRNLPWSLSGSLELPRLSAPTCARSPVYGAPYRGSRVARHLLTGLERFRGVANGKDPHGPGWTVATYSCGPPHEAGQNVFAQNGPVVAI